MKLIERQQKLLCAVDQSGFSERVLSTVAKTTVFSVEAPVWYVRQRFEASFGNFLTLTLMRPVVVA